MEIYFALLKHLFRLHSLPIFVFWWRFFLQFLFLQYQWTGYCIANFLGKPCAYMTTNMIFYLIFLAKKGPYVFLAHMFVSSLEVVRKKDYFFISLLLIGVAWEIVTRIVPCWRRCFAPQLCICKTFMYFAIMSTTGRILFITMSNIQKTLLQHNTEIFKQLLVYFQEVPT